MWLHEQSERLATQSRRAGTKGESSTKAMRRSCTEHLTETLLPQHKDLVAVVGNKIIERSVSVYLARAKPRFTAKVVQDQEPEVGRFATHADA